MHRQPAEPAVFGGAELLRVFGLDLRALLAPLADGEQRVGDDAGEEQQAVEQADAAVDRGGLVAQQPRQLGLAVEERAGFTARADRWW